MSARRWWRALAVIAAWALSACAAAAPVDFRVYVPPGELPLRGADRIVVWRTEAGVAVRDSVQTLAIGTRAVELGEIPFGADLGVSLEARVGEVPLARARSFPFDYVDADSPPELSVDLTLLRVGRSAPVPLAAPGAPVVAMTATSTGALLALADGRVLAFVAHGGELGAPSWVEVTALPARVGARWAPFGDALLGIGGASAGASLVGAEGVIAELSAGSEPLDTPALLVGDLSLREATLVRSDARSVSHVTWSEGQLRFAPRAALAVAVEDASRGARVDTRSGVRVLIVEASRVRSIDPLGLAADEELMLPSTLGARAVAALETGLAVLAGGFDPGGAPSAEVSVLLVRPERTPALELLAPAPQPLFTARGDAALLPYASGLALVVGGSDAAGAPRADTELLDVRLDRLPGEVVVTGPLPVAVARPAGVALRDGSVLVAGESSVALHAPAR